MVPSKRFKSSTSLLGFVKSTVMYSQRCSLQAAEVAE